MAAFNVFLNGEQIDTVYYDSDMTAQEVQKSLVDHDGYESNIEVEIDPKSQDEISAKKLAAYIWDDDTQEDSLYEMLCNGEPKESHVLYHAAVILGLEDSLQETIDEWEI